MIANDQFFNENVFPHVAYLGFGLGGAFPRVGALQVPPLCRIQGGNIRIEVFSSWNIPIPRQMEFSCSREPILCNGSLDLITFIPVLLFIA